MEKLLNFKSFKQLNENQSDIEVEIKLEWEVKTHNINVPSVKLESFDKLFKKLVKFSKVIKFPLPTFHKGTITKKYIVFTSPDEMTNVEGATSTKIGVFDNLADIKKYRNSSYYIDIVEYTDITLTCVSEIKPRENWVMLGVIDYKEGLVKPAPDKQIPYEYLSVLTGSSYCDHCRKTVNRNKIVFIQNEDNKEIKKIGGSCIKYYLGFDYEKVLGYLEDLNVLLNETSEYEGGYHGNKEQELTNSVEDIFKYYAFFVKTHNTHISGKAASAYNATIQSGETTGNFKTSTAQDVMDDYNKANVVPDPKDYKKSYEYNQAYEDWKEASEKFVKAVSTISDEEYKDFVDFVEAKKQESNFMLNAANKINDGLVSYSAVKYITGACSFYFGIKMAEKYKAERDANKKSELEQKQATSTYLGTIGEKSKFVNLTIKKIHGFDTAFGWSNVYNMEDPDGNVIIKFGTISDKFVIGDDKEVKVGTILSFTADIKDHKEYNGVKQTTIGRCSKL